MNAFSCAEILAGRAPTDTPVTLKGWVRTRRDSKAGISFVHVSDGSCFHPVQVGRAEHAAELCGGSHAAHRRLRGGGHGHRSCRRRPRASRSRCRRAAIDVIGWVEDPDTYPIQPKPHTLEFLREVAHLRPRTNVIGAVTRVRACDRACDPPLLSRRTASSGSTRRSSRRRTPKAPARCSACRRST